MARGDPGLGDCPSPLRDEEPVSRDEAYKVEDPPYLGRQHSGNSLTERRLHVDRGLAWGEKVCGSRLRLRSRFLPLQTSSVGSEDVDDATLAPT